MARISTYNLDGTISDSDKVIGTDSSNTTTKNFRVQDLKEFIYSEISGNMSIAADGTASVATSNIALGINSGDYVAGITGGVGVDSTAATSGAGTNHTLSLNLSELSTVTSISTGNKVAISPSNAGNLITVDNLFVKSPKLVSEAAVANGDYMLFLDGGATGDMKKESLSDISTLFAGTGLVSSSSIINLDLNSLSAKSSIVQGDSLIIVDSEDSNSNKKVTYAILEDEVYSNISGDVTINSSGVSAIGADKVKGTMLHTSAADTSTLELSSDTLSVLKVPNALTAGDGLASGGTFDGANSRTFSLDLNELTDATIANGDSIPFVDATDNTTKREALSHIVDLLAGDGLSASSSVLSVGVDDSTIEINSDALRVKANGINNNHIDKTAITGQSDLGDAFADADTILLHDATASALREGTMAHLASYVNGAYDLEASLEALNASDNIIKIGHSSDKVQIIGTFQVDGVSTLTGNTTVTGSLTANGLTFPSSADGENNNQVLTKTGNGTIGFSASAATSVSDVASDNASHLPIVLHDGSNNLLDDDNGLTFQASTGLLKVNKLSPQSNAAGNIGSSTVAYNNLFLANGTSNGTSVIEFIQGTGNRSQITHIDGGVDGNGDRLDGSLRISSKTKLEFNDNEVYIASLADGHLDLVSDTEVQIVSPIVNIDASNKVDVSGALTVGGALTLPNQTAKHFFAAPTGSAGAPSFRAIAVADVPTLNQSTTGSAATLTTARNFSLTGDVTASAVSFNGSAVVALSTSLAANTVDSSELVDGSINTSHIGDDQVTGAKIADDTIDSNHYAAGSIDNEHIADNAINSEHYAAGSIDNEHLASNSVNSSNYVDASIDTEHLSSGCTAPKVTVTAYTSGVFPIVLHNDSNQLFDDTSNFQFKKTNSNISSTTDNQYTLTLGETTSYAHYLHGGNIDFKSGATISTHDAGIYIMGNAYYKLVSGSGGFVKKIAAPSEVLKLRDQELTLSVHTSNGDTSSKMTLTEVFSVTAAGNLTVTGELDGATLDISGNADINGNLTGVNAFTASGKIQGAEIEGTSLDINGNADISGILDITNTTDSTNDSGDTGALRCEGGASINGKIYANGNVTAPNFVVASDRRLKSEIEPIKEGLEVIKQFTSYNYIKRGEKESGFIAQEVQKVLPHTVYENSDGMLSMSDRGVVAHMHKAILELEKRLISIEEKLR